MQIKNQNKYQNFQDEQEYSQGQPIPIGQPVHFEMQQMQPPRQQQPYFQQPQVHNPYQHQPQFVQQPIQPTQQQFYQINPPPMPMAIQPTNPKMYNHSINVRCQCCKQTVQTIVNNETGNTAHAWAFALCCVVGQCCCIPYLFDDCLDKTHYCPNCGQTILRKHAKCFDIIN